jgi:tRNA pseudouridine55 synthase
MTLSGLLVVDKPAAMTSHDVVYKIRRAAGVKRVGHAGTLDPDATGVLLVLVGSSARLSDFLMGQAKRYRATLCLGVTTSTEDASGEILTKTSAAHICGADLDGALPRFIGDIAQIPPMVSAVHHDGKRLYELARKGFTVDREPRTVHIESIEKLSFSPGKHASAELDVVCGKGAYIRTLCADIGAALGVGGHMAALRRTAVGQWTINDAVELAHITAETIADLIVPPARAVSFLQEFHVNPEQQADVRNGKLIPASAGLSMDQKVRILAQDGHLLAVGTVTVDGIHPGVVLAD